MNESLRNFPKPLLASQTPDCGLSQRREIVAQVCDRVNELVEYCYLTPESDQFVAVPGQSNIDERMPTTFLRPCIDRLNGIIIDRDLIEIDPLPQIGNNMDYHGFLPWVNRIVIHMNLINEAL